MPLAFYGRQPETKHIVEVAPHIMLWNYFNALELLLSLSNGTNAYVEYKFSLK